MKLRRILFFTLKQYLKSPVIWAILLCMPLLTILIQTNNNTESANTITAVFYMPTETDDMKLLYNNLKNYNGLFRFLPVENMEEVYDAVLTQEAECGYIFSSDFLEQVTQGDREHQIQVIVSPATTMAPIINETLYSVLFPEISNKTLFQYLSQRSEIAVFYEEGLFREEDVSQIYRNYLKNGSTFHFEYEGAPNEYKLTTQQVLLSPVRGLLSILVLLSAFAGSLAFYKEAKNPIFSNAKVRISYLLIPTLLTGTSGFICIFLSNLAQDIGKELLAMVFYILLCNIFVYFVTIVIKNPVIFASMIPVFLIGCFLFTPVFFDIGLLLPKTRPISYLFLPYYYLKIF